MKQVFAVHQASTLCGENETELYSSPVDARVRYTELITEYMSRGDDLHILESTDHEFYADNESAGTYNRIAIETIKIQ
jgi:hypothetical protein